MASCARWHLHLPFCFFSVWRRFSESSFILFLLFLNIRIIIFSRTHPCRQNSLGRDAPPQDFSSLKTESSRQGCTTPGFFIPADKISSSGMHHHGIFHPCRQNLLGRDAPPQDFSSLKTESSRQGCTTPGFFIPTDRISSAGMHRPEIFHPCRQNLLVRDASPQDFSSLQTKSPRQGCTTPGFFIPADRIFSAGMHRLRNYSLGFRAPPQSAKLTSIHLNACRAYPDKAGSSDFQTAGFHSR